MDTENKIGRDRLIALALVSLLLVIVYGPAARFFVAADQFVYDQIAGRLVAETVSDGVVVTINPAGKSDAEITEEYNRILTRLRTHESRRIIMPQPPAIPAGEKLPAWTSALRDGPPVFVPSRHPLAAVSAGSGYLDVRPDSDGVLRRSNLWYLNGGQMSPSLPLAIALANQDGLPAASVARNDAVMFIAGYKALPRLTGDDLLAGRYSGADLRAKTVFLDSNPELIAATAELPSGQYVTPSELVAAMLGSIEGGSAITAPGWAGVMEILTPAVLAVLVILLLPGHSRPAIALAAVLAIIVLLVVEAALLVAAHMRFDLGRPIIVLAGASLVAAWLSRSKNPKLVSGNALRRGTEFLSAGRLEPAFAELRRCSPSDELANVLHRLSMAFDEQAQPDRAQAVLNWMQRAQQESAAAGRMTRGTHTASARSPAREGQTASHTRSQTARRSQSEPVRQSQSAPVRKSQSAPVRKSQSAPVRQSQPAPANQSQSESPRPSANALLQTQGGTPRELGRYVIEKKIGRGAMGSVYLARDPRINRSVALKVIPIEQEFEDEELKEARERFFLEAESAGRLAHPYIITVFDCGEDKHLAYIAMEYLQGTSLTYFKDPKRLLAPRKALELCARTAEGLDYAHNQGVIHRDIKPANLLYNARADVLKISDFGVARLTDNNRTKTGIVLGTPMYMAPEQLSAEKLTGHSDLFSLGVTLYELLTGQVPFHATNIAVLMRKITSEDPEPVSNRRPGIPPSVDTVLFKALAKRPEDRFPNGAEMAVALRNCAKYAST